MRHPNTPTRRTTAARRAWIGIVAGLALVAAACGSDSDSSDSAETTEAPTDSVATTDAASSTEPATTDGATSGDTTPADSTADGSEVDQRVVSLSPTHTEIMFAIGAEDQLVAIDDQSNYPPQALDLPHDLSGYEPNVEAIAAYEPDLVLIGGDFTGLGEQLDSIGIESWDGPAATTLDDTYAQIEQIGAATGHVAEAAELVSSLQTEIDAIIEATPELAEPLAYYHELSPDLYSADSTTFIGELYGLLGLRNIADQTEGNSGGYPQLNAEFLVSADPDLIFLADTKCCAETAETVAARPGWETIAAVVNGNVIEMDDDVASRWGPRVVDYLATIAAAVDQAAIPA